VLVEPIFGLITSLVLAGTLAGAEPDTAPPSRFAEPPIEQVRPVEVLPAQIVGPHLAQIARADLLPGEPDPDGLPKAVGAEPAETGTVTPKAPSRSLADALPPPPPPGDEPVLDLPKPVEPKLSEVPEAPAVLAPAVPPPPVEPKLAEVPEAPAVLAPAVPPPPVEPKLAEVPAPPAAPRAIQIVPEAPAPGQPPKTDEPPAQPKITLLPPEPAPGVAPGQPPMAPKQLGDAERRALVHKAFMIGAWVYEAPLPNGRSGQMRLIVRYLPEGKLAGIVQFYEGGRRSDLRVSGLWMVRPIADNRFQLIVIGDRTGSSIIVDIVDDKTLLNLTNNVVMRRLSL
jgi:hypothetical protein